MHYKRRNFALVLFLGTFLFGCLKNFDEELVTSALKDAYNSLSVSDSEMISLANQSIGSIDDQSRVAGENDPYTIRLNRLFDDYKYSAQVTLEYKVYYDNSLNAFAMPNGSIRVHTALMDLLDDDELLGVIGHEIGHVVEKHSLARYKNSYRALALRKGIAATSGTAGKLAAADLGEIGQKFLTKRFSRSNELEADVYGVNLLKDGGYDPRALITAFEKMRKVHGDRGGLFASHPSNSARIKAIEDLIAGI